MPEKRTKRCNTKSILHAFAVIVIILNSGYYRTTITDSYLPLTLLVFTAAVCFFLNHMRGSKGFHPNLYLVMILAGILLSVIFNLSLSNILSGGRVAVTMLCSYLILKNTVTERIFQIYNKMIRIFILMSAFLMIIIQLGYTDFPTLAGYYDLIIVSVKVNGSRIMGPFWEPGVFATAIIFAFIIDLYFSERKISFYKTALYSFGIILTKSTAGVVILIFIFIAYLMKTTKLDRKKIFNFLFVITLIIGFVFYEELFQWLNQVNPQLFGKLVEPTSTTSATRIYAPLVNLQIFFRHPVFGMGFTDAATEFAKFMGFAGGMHIVAQTSTSTQILAAIGIFGIAYTIAILSFAVGKKERNFSFIAKNVITTSMLLIVNKEPHIYNAMTWFLILYMSAPRKKTFTPQGYI